MRRNLLVVTNISFIVAAVGIYCKYLLCTYSKQISAEIESLHMAVHNKITAFGRWKGKVTHLLYCSSKYKTLTSNKFCCKGVPNWTSMRLPDMNYGSLVFVPAVTAFYHSCLRVWRCSVRDRPIGGDSVELLVWTLRWAVAGEYTLWAHDASILRLLYAWNVYAIEWYAVVLVFQCSIYCIEAAVSLHLSTEKAATHWESRNGQSNDTGPVCCCL